MAIRKIVFDKGEGSEFLRKVSKPVTEFDAKLHELLDDLTETMLTDSQGVGLAAVQVGVLKRVFVVEVPGKAKKEFVNPEIIGMSEARKLLAEACLSVPNKYGKVMRPVWVRVRAQDRNGNWFVDKYKGFEAHAIVHEFDHLNGIVFTDIME